MTRNNTVLIRLNYWDLCKPTDDLSYEKGFIVLVDPEWYFTRDNPDGDLKQKGMTLGRNTLLAFERRSDWETYGPPNMLPDGTALSPAKSRRNPLEGNYVARVAATVSDHSVPIISGFDTTGTRGAGIRVYEYAPKNRIAECRLQLEALMWKCRNSIAAMSAAGMTADDAKDRKCYTIEAAKAAGLLDIDRLTKLRILTAEGHTCCPLCLDPLDAASFLSREEQAPGRETHDLTTTQISLFHLRELRVGELGHRSYNLAWGHHHCNVVVKDAGIDETLKWMQKVLRNHDNR